MSWVLRLEESASEYHALSVRFSIKRYALNQIAAPESLAASLDVRGLG